MKHALALLMSSACAAVVAATAPLPGCTVCGGSAPVPFRFSDSTQTWPVPADGSQTWLFVELWGSGGEGNEGSGGESDNEECVCIEGAGAYVSGYLRVTPGETLQIIIGVSGAGYRGGGGRSSIQRPVSGVWTDAVSAGGGGAGVFEFFPPCNNGSCSGGGGRAICGSTVDNAWTAQCEATCPAGVYANCVSNCTQALNGVNLVEFNWFKGGAGGGGYFGGMCGNGIAQSDSFTSWGGGGGSSKTDELFNFAGVNGNDCGRGCAYNGSANYAQGVGTSLGGMIVITPVPPGVMPPGYTPPGPGPSPPGPPVPLIVGVVVAILVAAAATVAVFVLCHRRRRHHHHKREKTEEWSVTKNVMIEVQLPPVAEPPTAPGDDPTI